MVACCPWLIPQIYPPPLLLYDTLVTEMGQGRLEEERLEEGRGKGDHQE